MDEVLIKDKFYKKVLKEFVRTKTGQKRMAKIINEIVEEQINDNEVINKMMYKMFDKQIKGEFY